MGQGAWSGPLLWSDRKDGQSDGTDDPQLLVAVLPIEKHTILSITF